MLQLFLHWHINQKFDSYSTDLDWFTLYDLQTELTVWNIWIYDQTENWGSFAVCFRFWVNWRISGTSPVNEEEVKSHSEAEAETSDRDPVSRRQSYNTTKHICHCVEQLHPSRPAGPHSGFLPARPQTAQTRTNSIMKEKLQEQCWSRQHHVMSNWERLQSLAGRRHLKTWLNMEMTSVRAMKCTVHTWNYPHFHLTFLHAYAGVGNVCSLVNEIICMNKSQPCIKKNKHVNLLLLPSALFDALLWSLLSATENNYQQQQAFSR